MSAIPTIDKFFSTWDVEQGVLYYTIGLLVLRVLTLLAVFPNDLVRPVESSQIVMWSQFSWCCFDLVCYALVVIAVVKKMSPAFLIPAMIGALINSIVGISLASSNLFYRKFLGAVVSMVYSGINLHYFLGLYTVYKK